MDQSLPPKLSRKGTWRTYTTAEGLAGLQTEHIAEDAEGYLWVGTWDSGVSRFDGDEFCTFTVKDGLPGNRIQAILLDRQGRLWFGTDGGTCWWDGKEFHRFDPGDGVSDKWISFIFEDQEGRVWFGGGEALGYYDGSFHDLIPAYCHQHGQSPQPSREYECQGIAQDREGHLWFAFSTNLVRYDGEYFHRYGEEHGLPPGRRTVGTDATGELWIGCGVNLYRYRDQTFQSVPIEIKAQHIRKIQRDQEGRTWFCTTGEGVFCHDGAGFHYFTPQDGLAYDLVNAVFQDREGHFWFATWGGGLSCFDPSIQVLDGKEGLPFNTVTTLAADHQGRIWMGFALWLGSKTSEVVSCYDGEHLTTFGRQEGMASCLTLYVDSRDRLWCGGLGLRQYEGERFQELGREAGLERIGVSAFTEDQGGRLILGHWQEATSYQKITETPLQLTRYDGQRFQTLLTREKASGNLCINALVAGRGQGIWFALGSSDSLDLGEGLGRWHETEGLRYYTVEDGLVDNRVTGLLEDPQGHLWITTSGGLSRFDGERFHNFTVADGLPSKRIHCACQDPQGHLWFGTDNGVVCYDGHTFQTIRSPQITSVNDLLQDRQGRFWLATNKGLVRYLPGRVPPKVRILQVAGQVYEGVEEVSTFSQQVLFEYKGLSFRTLPKDMLYTYRLQGHEEEWQQPTREMRAFYQDLPLGEYTFEVRAIDRDLNYSAPASLRLKVVPDLRDERIDELERRVRERTRELEEQNRELFVERAVERVRAEAATLKESRDIGRLILALEAVWRECGLRFESGGINIVDEQAGWFQNYSLFPEGILPQERVVQKHVVEGIHLVRTIPVSLSWARERGWPQPGDEPALSTMPETYPEDVRHVWGIDVPGAERYVGRAAIGVPFAYGGIWALAEEGDQFQQEDLELVKRFAGAVSLGYTRFFDLQAAEERARQQIRELAVEHVRNEALSMRSSEDLRKVVAVMWKEMVKLGVETPGCSFQFVDEEIDRFEGYGAHDNPKKYGISWTSPTLVELDADTAVFARKESFSQWIIRASSTGAPDFRERWHEGKPWSYIESEESRQSRLVTQSQLMGFDRPLPTFSGDRVVTNVPFQYGTVGFREREYSEEHVAIVQELTSALELGYLRYLDFQRLEEQNRQLFIEGAVERVRAEAATMKESRDIGRLILALYAGWRECGLRFEIGGINITDEQAGWLQTYSLVPEGILPEERIVQKQVVEGWHLVNSIQVSLSWAKERGYAAPDLEPAFFTAPEPETYREDMSHIWGADSPFAERYVGRMGITVPVPFASSGIWIVAEEGYQFQQEDLEIGKRFAGAVSLGYTRFFDLQQAEARARQSQRQAAVDRVRAEIATMRTSGDLERVTPLLWKELTGLSVPFLRCGMFIVDEENQRLQAYLTNPQGASLATLDLGFDSLPIISQTVHHWREQRVYVAQWDQQAFVEMMEAFIAQGQPIQRERYLDASPPPERLTLQLVPFAYGMLYVGSAAPLSEEDIGLVKDLAAAFSVAYARYLDFQRLEAQNRALEEANAKIQEANRLKSQFLANMSHELRTPLNAIVGFSRIVHRKAQGLLPQRQVENIEKVLQSSEFLMSLINDILDLSKIEAGRLEIQPEWFSLHELIGGCTSTVSPMVKRGVELRADLPPQLDRIHSDPSRVRQVLINLLSNAAKFTEKGSITVALQPAGEDCVELSVADTGIGIPAEAREFIFEEFRQVDGSTTRRYGGTGLGLSITKKLIEMLGGSIRVESEEGKGSTFIVTLPALGAPGPAPAPQVRDLAERTPAPGRRLVLSIDDDPNVLSLLAQELEEEGYQVVGVTRALEGIEKARHSAPYAITLDIMMPGMDGWEAIAKLKGDPRTRDIPLIVISIIDDRELGFRLGADEYLVKPIDKETLLRVLHRYEGRGQEVLVADDDPAVVELVRQLLEEFGWKVRAAADGQQALDQIARQKPDVLLLDLMMPAVDGFETLRQLRSDPQTRDLPVVVITAKDLSPQEREELLQSTSRIIAKDGMERERLLHELRESLKGLNQRGDKEVS